VSFGGLVGASWWRSVIEDGLEVQLSEGQVTTLFEVDFFAPSIRQQHQQHANFSKWKISLPMISQLVSSKVSANCQLNENLFSDLTAHENGCH